MCYEECGPQYVICTCKPLSTEEILAEQAKLKAQVLSDSRPMREATDSPLQGHIKLPTEGEIFTIS